MPSGARQMPLRTDDKWVQHEGLADLGMCLMIGKSTIGCEKGGGGGEAEIIVGDAVMEGVVDPDGTVRGVNVEMVAG